MDDGWVPLPLLLLLTTPLIWWVACPSIVLVCSWRRTQRRARTWLTSVCTSLLVTAACCTVFLLTGSTLGILAWLRVLGLPLVCVAVVTALTLRGFMRERGGENGPAIRGDGDLCGLDSSPSDCS